MTRSAIKLVLFVLGAQLVSLRPALAVPQQIISLGSLERIPWAERDLPDGMLVFAPSLPVLERGYTNRFETLMHEFAAGLEQVPGFLQMDSYQQIVTQVERLVTDYGRFQARVKESIVSLDALIEQSRSDAAVVDRRIDALSQRDDLPPPQRDRMQAQMTALHDRLTEQAETLGLNQTTLLDRQPVFAAVQAEMAEYLDQISGLGSDALLLGGGAGQLAAGAANPLPAIPRGQESVLVPGTALPLYDYEANGPVNFFPNPSLPLSAIPEPNGIVLIALAAISMLLARAGRRRAH